MSNRQKNRSAVGADLGEKSAGGEISSSQYTAKARNRQALDCTPRVQALDFDLVEFLNDEDNDKGKRARRLARLHALRRRGVGR